MTTELLPCPFCGSSGQIGTIDGLDAIAYCSNIDCPAHEILACGPSAWNTRALPSSPDEKSAQEICGRCGQPRSERCGNDFIPMSAENLAKREAAQAATAVNTAEGVRRLSLDEMYELPEYKLGMMVIQSDASEAQRDLAFAIVNRIHRERSSPPASASMSAGVTAETLRAMRADALQILDAKDTTLNPTMCRVTMEQLFDRAMYSAERARANTRAGVDDDDAKDAARWRFAMTCGYIVEPDREDCNYLDEVPPTIQESARDAIDAAMADANGTAGDAKGVGVAVNCTVCGNRKKPVGRDSPMGSNLCDHECEGYWNDPKPGDLWPGETREQFGY